MTIHSLRSNDHEWSAWEKEVADAINSGNTVKASGRLTMFKGDVKSDSLLIDCKYTQSDGYRVSFDLFSKLNEWAINENRTPALAICIDPNKAYGQVDCDSICKIAVIPEYMYEDVGGDPVRIVYKDKHSGSACFTENFEGSVQFSISKWRKRFSLVAMSFDRFIDLVNDYEEKKDQ